MELIMASSSDDTGISCWDLSTGAEQLRLKSCSSPSHGLLSFSNGFIASSQTKHPSSPVGSIFYWSLNKPQVEVRSTSAEPIKPLVSNHHGTFLFGGGISGNIYIWEVLTGRLLKKWHGHYRSVTCLALSDDDSFLVSGAEDGGVKVWCLFMIFDDLKRKEATSLYEYSFTDHTMPVTDIVIGYGGCNAIIVSASEDRTCKVWSLSTGKLLRTVVFPSIINSIAMDPAEDIFYAGARDGRTYIAALNSICDPNSKYGIYIIGILSDHSKSVSCLKLSGDGTLLISGCEDGMVRVLDIKTSNTVRILKHAKAPVTNIIIVRTPDSMPSGLLDAPRPYGRKHRSSLPPLERYENEEGDAPYKGVLVTLPGGKRRGDATYVSSILMEKLVKELQEKEKGLEEKDGRRIEMKWRRMSEKLYELCVSKLLGEEEEEEEDQVVEPN